MINKWFGILSNHGHKMYKRLRSNIPTYLSRCQKSCVDFAKFCAALQSCKLYVYLYLLYSFLNMCTLSDSQANLLRVVLNHKLLNKCQDFSRFETDTTWKKKLLNKYCKNLIFFLSLSPDKLLRYRFLISIRCHFSRRAEIEILNLYNIGRMLNHQKKSNILMEEKNNFINL